MSVDRAPDRTRRLLRRACDPLTLLLGVTLALPVALAVYAFENDVTWARRLFFASFGFASGVVAVILRTPCTQTPDGDDADHVATDGPTRRGATEVGGPATDQQMRP